MATSAASSEHFEKLHEIFRGLLEDLQGVPERLLGTVGTGERGRDQTERSPQGAGSQTSISGSGRPLRARPLLLSGPGRPRFAASCDDSGRAKG